MAGFYLLVELHPEGYGPAACAAGLFKVRNFNKTGVGVVCFFPGSVSKGYITVSSGDWMYEGQHIHQVTNDKGEEWEDEGQHGEWAPFLDKHYAACIRQCYSCTYKAATAQQRFCVISH